MTSAEIPQTVVVELRDRPGALYRVIGAIRRNGYDIERLTVAPAERVGHSRLVAVLTAADGERLTRQLARLVDVVSAAASPFNRSAAWPSSTTTQMPTYDL